MPQFTCPAILFANASKVKTHFRKGGTYEVNGFFAQGEGAGYKINKYIVEKQPSYAELETLIKNNTSIKNPAEKIRAHI